MSTLPPLTTTALDSGISTQTSPAASIAPTGSETTARVSSVNWRVQKLILHPDRSKAADKQ